MHRDAVGATQLGKHGEGNRIRFHRAPRLSNIGNVIDVDPEAGHTNVRLSGSYERRSWR